MCKTEWYDVNTQDLISVREHNIILGISVQLEQISFQVEGEPESRYYVYSSVKGEDGAYTLELVSLDNQHEYLCVILDENAWFFGKDAEAYIKLYKCPNSYKRL